MTIEPTYLEGCFILKPEVFSDHRGSFFESFNARDFAEAAGFIPDFVQENQSISEKGVLRGLHFQKGAYAQAKLVRVVKGEAQDVVVDLRRGSETFGKHFSILLNDENKHQLYIPRGFAHGFLCLTDAVVFSYKCDAYYHPESESGIFYNDPTLNIVWELPDDELVLSERDRGLPRFETLFL